MLCQAFESQPNCIKEPTLERCKNCGSQARMQLRKDFNDEVCECSACGGLTFVMPLQLEPERVYSEGYFHGEEYTDYSKYSRSHSKNFRRKIDYISRQVNVANEVKVLELGAATGEFYHALAKHSGVRLTEYLGVEVSDYARARAAEQGVPMVSPLDPSCQARVKQLRPNIIAAWDVWEHLEDPVQIFDSLLEHAAPNVTVAISTVDFGALVPKLRGRKWRQYHPPTHLNYPTRESFRKYFADRSFSIRYHASFGSHRPLIEYTRFLGSGAWPTLLRGLDATPLYLNTFDTQLVIATREAHI